MNETFLYTTIQDPLARPLLEGLTREYNQRYHDIYQSQGGSARDEIERYPAQAFAPPEGAFLLLLRDHQAIGGGAFMRHRDPDTAELKRMWTHHELRRQGLARKVLTELEAQAQRQGYTRIYLTTGARQPEAIQLYLHQGYQPLFDLQAPNRTFDLPFEKQLGAATATRLASHATQTGYRSAYEPAST